MVIIISLAVFGIPIGLIQYANCVNNRAATDKMEALFSGAFEEYGGLFTPKKGIAHSNLGSYDFYITYNGAEELFLDSCVEFCVYSQDVVFERYRERDFFIFECGDYYFAKREDVYSTDFFTDDFSALEEIGSIHKFTRLVIDAEEFTAEQRERLYSVLEDYSFEILIDE